MINWCAVLIETIQEYEDFFFGILWDRQFSFFEKIWIEIACRHGVQSVNCDRIEWQIIYLMSKRTTVALLMGWDNLKYVLYGHPRVRTAYSKYKARSILYWYSARTYHTYFFTKRKANQKRGTRRRNEKYLKNFLKRELMPGYRVKNKKFTVLKSYKI